MGFDHVVRIEQLGLVAGGATLSLEVQSGSAVAVLGRAGSGKSTLLRCIKGEERLMTGSIRVSEAATVCDDRSLPRKGKLLAGLHASKAATPDWMIRALHQLELWKLRNEDVSRLSPSQASAVCLVHAFNPSTAVVLVDMLLDWVDPVVRHSVLESLRQRRSEGVIVFIATHSPEIVSLCDALVVVKQREFGFSGSLEQLRTRAMPTEFSIETTRSGAVRSMIEPLTVRVEEDGDTLRLQSFEGQELAQRLLIEGYGDVRYVVVKRPPLEELILQLL